MVKDHPDIKARESGASTKARSAAATPDAISTTLSLPDQSQSPTNVAEEETQRWEITRAIGKRRRRKGHEDDVYLKNKGPQGYRELRQAGVSQEPQSEDDASEFAESSIGGIKKRSEAPSFPKSYYSRVNRQKSNSRKDVCAPSKASLPLRRYKRHHFTSPLVSDEETETGDDSDVSNYLPTNIPRNPRRRRLE